MAFSLNLLGIRWCSGKYELERIPSPPGLTRPSFSDPRFRDVGSNDGYMDFMAVLKPEEVMEMARTQIEHLPAILAPPESLAHLKEALSGVSFVVAHVYEWESGLG